MNGDYAVELINVSKHFGEVVAVDNLSLGILDGEFFSLLGPSGCGKTTTLRLIAGFELPTRGEVRIGGVTLGYLPPYKRPVNTVFQQYALFPHMSVYKNVAFGLEMQGYSDTDIKARVQEALAMVHLEGMERRRPKQLSGGQQQRVALARALVNRPKVLLLDEPLGALDLKLRKKMQAELKMLQEQVGITFIYVTHDQEEALTMSDRIGVMDHGVLLQVGSGQEIYESPTTRFVADFIGDTNYLDGTVVGPKEDLLEVTFGNGSRALVPPNPAVKSGEVVSVAFRPEKGMINPHPHDSLNILSKCRVIDIVYTGSFTTYELEAFPGAHVVIRQQNDAFTPDIRVQAGDQVSIGWPIRFSRAFKAKG